MNVKTKIIIAFVAGVLLTIFTYQAYVVYQFRALYAADHATLQQVTDFLNQNIAQAQKAAGITPAQTAPAPTPTKK